MTRAIIVGNGVSVLDIEAGRLIDAYDKVIRINNFKIKGYEKFVGTETDILFTCTTDNYSINKVKEFSETIYCLCPLPNILNVTPKTIIEWDYVYNKVKPSINNLTGYEYPSTGLIAIHYFVFTRGYDVSIIGFDNFKDGRAAHYFEPDRQNYPDRHNGEKERLYIERLINENKLKKL